MHSDVELPKNKEVIFQSWLAELNNRFWLNPDAMPEGVYETIQIYLHFDAHSHREESAEKMKEAGENFKKLTIYEIQDFVKYQEEQNQKLEIDKK